jgi:hypothetical protein
MRTTVLILSLVLAASGSGCRSASAPSPVVSSVLPDAASTGTKVTVTGTGFDSAGNAVQIGPGYLLGLASADGTTITFTLPEAVGVCPPDPNRACVTLALLLTPGQYSLGVITKAGSSNQVVFVVRER